MVFQHFNLFPHLTVKKNLELAPTLLKLNHSVCRVGVTKRSWTFVIRQNRL